MQNKGIVKFVAVMLILVCIFYLSFSFVTRHYENKAAEISALKGEEAGKAYLDSLMNEKVYFGAYTLRECREMEIGLGLDLKGGMNVILEVSVPDVIDILADHKTDPLYKKSMEEAKKAEETSQDDFISLFINAWKKNAPGKPLASVFATQQMKDKVTTKSSDSEVESALRTEVSAAVDNAGVKEPERVRKLLQGSANLEFWETYNSQEIVPLLSQLNAQYAAGETAADTTKAVVADTTQVAAAAADTTKAKEGLAAAMAKKDTKDNKEAQSAAQAAMSKQNPLFSVFTPTQGQTLAVVGYALTRDTAAVNKILHSDVAKRILPADLKLLWGAKPSDLEFTDRQERFELYAIDTRNAINGRAPLEGDVIVNSRDGFDQHGRPEVTMQMNGDGARRWSQLTHNNINKAVAIVLDDAVYSAPRVNQQIDGGSSITGNFTIQDTKDLANTLNSGKMPAPTRIVQSDVVGPTLGAQSIKQGAISFVVAFVLLMIYMVLLYNWIPGMLANIALLFNLFFTLGILTSFQAALTMPGIAGIVLTLGTAVDANVLIYERTKEELRKGLNVKEALTKGYSNAFSAIFDSNLTSLITGIILYVVGTGPIRGFATTLMIGICVSFFTAVFMTRLVYEYQLKRDRWRNLTFSTPYSRNMMQNTHFNFMGMYKKTFTVWGVAAIIIVVSFFINGLSRSIDFTGGRNYIMQFEKSVEPEQVREILNKAFVEKDANGAEKVANTTAIALGAEGNRIRVSTNYKIDSNDPNVDDEAEEILFKALKDAGIVTQANVDDFKNPDVREGGSIISSAKVGPSIAKDITHRAFISVAIALIAIFLYILFRFRNVAFSVGSTIALALDALVVIGYSINDKVVVFDRVRENIGLFGKRDRQTLFNDSLNQTLARTINTSVTTLIVLLCIFILGGDSIRSFSFAMILGVIFGTCSSIFIAAPVAYLTMGRTIKEDAAEVVEAKK